MKKILTLLSQSLGMLLLCFTAFSSWSQTGMEDLKWFELAPPNDQYETKSVSVNVLDNGKIYMTYVHYNDQELKVAKLNKLENQWDIVASYAIDQAVGFSVNDMIAYANGNDLYFAVRRNGSPSDYLSLFHFDASENLSVILENQAISFYGPTSFNMTVDTGNNIAYFTAYDSNFTSAVVSACDMSSQMFDDIITFGDLSSLPDIAINAQTNTLFLSCPNSTNQIIIRTAALQPSYTSINFSLLNGDGYVLTSLLANPVAASSHQLIEKEAGDPDVIFSINAETPDDGLYRVNIGTLNTDIIFDSYTQAFDIPFAYSFESTGRGDNSYVYGINGWQQPASAIEVFPNGDEYIVATDNNEFTLDPEGAENIKIHASKFDDRLVGYYREYGPAPEVPGMFTITNRAPSVQSVSTVPQGCFSTSSTAVFVDNIVFDDPEGDEVAIVANSVQTSGDGFVDAMQDVNGNWQLYGNFDQPGSVNISFSYTDGMDTMLHQFNYDPGSEPTFDFNASSQNFCFSDLPLQSSDLINEPVSGQFVFASFELPTASPELITWSDLESINYTFGNETIMLYETLDQYGCLYELAGGITLYDNPEISIVSQPSSCGSADGSADATVTGANGPITEYWSTGSQNTNSVSNLPPGTYYYNVEDEEGCKAVAQANIGAAGLSVTGTTVAPSCHNGDDGSIELNLSGFANPTILWSTGQGSLSIEDLTAGTYEVTVWDNEDCKVTTSFSLNNPDKFSVDFDVTLPTSCSSADGEISVNTENNASGSVSYTWTGGATGSALTGIGNGVYEVTAFDGTCAYESNFAVNSISGPSAIANITNSECDQSNGEIFLSVNANTGEEISGFDWTNGETTQNLTGLAPGVYGVEIEQTDGCTSFYEFEVKTKRPAMQEICVVTVDSLTNTNLVVWEKPMANNIDFYNIYRETAVLGEYKIVGTVDYEDMSVFNDVVASPEVRSWRYRISAVNTCGVESHLSPVHKTIHIVTQDIGGGFVGVYWDNYEGIEYSEYDCYRYTDNDGWVLLLEGVPYTALPYYLDPISQTQDLDYFIEVDPDKVCVADFGRAQDYNSTRSNKRENSFAPGDGTGDPNNDLNQFENPNFGVEIFPNPSNGLFYLSLTVLKPGAKVTVEITDLTGRIIASPLINEGMNNIDLSSQAAGTYIVKVSDGDFLQSFRYVKK